MLTSASLTSCYGLFFPNTSCSCCRSEAVEVGGSARRLDPRPRRQNAAQEEDRVQEEEDVRPSEDGGQDVQEQQEEVAAAVDF